MRKNDPGKCFAGYISVQDAASLLRVCTRRVRAMRTAGLLNAVLFGGSWAVSVDKKLHAELEKRERRHGQN